MSNDVTVSIITLASLWSVPTTQVWGWCELGDLPYIGAHSDTGIGYSFLLSQAKEWKADREAGYMVDDVLETAAFTTRGVS